MSNQPDPRRRPPGAPAPAPAGSRVTSHPYDRFAPIAAPIGVSLSWRAIGLVALVFGLLLWLIGARYTLLGAPGVLAYVLDLFGIVFLLALPIGWAFLGLTIALGLTI